MRKPLLFVAILLIPIILTACSGSPKDNAEAYEERFPEEIGLFDINENQSVKLSNETVNNSGHITLVYENRSLGDLYVVIDTYATESATEVEYSRRLRELALMGVDVDADRAPAYRVFSKVDVIETPNGRRAIFIKATSRENRTVIIEAQYVKPDPDFELSEEAWDEIMTTIREVGEAVG